VYTDLNNLASALLDLGRGSEALPLLQRALAIDEAVYGPHHPDVSTDLNNLASALQALGRASDALPLYERALAIADAVYGPDHPRIQTIRRNLAACDTIVKSGSAS
jgi:tetratricopeptide (TPR) repeat protein